MRAGVAGVHMRENKNYPVGEKSGCDLYDGKNKLT